MPIRELVAYGTGSYIFYIAFLCPFLIFFTENKNIFTFFTVYLIIDKSIQCSSSKNKHINKIQKFLHTDTPIKNLLVLKTIHPDFLLTTSSGKIKTSPRQPVCRPEEGNRGGYASNRLGVECSRSK